MSAAEIATTCPDCEQTFYYSPENHKCPGQWKAELAAIGAVEMTEMYVGTTWVEECMEKQNSPKGDSCASAPGDGERAS